jgi:transposase-like protein
MSSRLVCPVCNQDVSTNPFKSWKFDKFEVKRYECQNCKSKFNLYRSPTRTYTIPKSK